MSQFTSPLQPVGAMPLFLCATPQAGLLDYRAETSCGKAQQINTLTQVFFNTVNVMSIAFLLEMRAFVSKQRFIKVLISQCLLTRLTHNGMLMSCCHTYQSDEEEQNLESPAQGGHTGDIAVAHRRHGHHEKVNAVPVGEQLCVQKVRRVPRVFKLKYISRALNRVGQGPCRDSTGRGGGMKQPGITF